MRRSANVEAPPAAQNVRACAPQAVQHPMSPNPLYDPASANAAYQLRYGWTAWPSQGSVFPDASHLIETVRPLWEEEGIRVLEHF
jgi:hypothetical protein